MTKRKFGPVKLSLKAQTTSYPVALDDVQITTDSRHGQWQDLNAKLYGQVNWDLMQAGVIVTMIPCMILFLTLQRYYVQGLMAGGVKA